MNIDELRAVVTADQQRLQQQLNTVNVELARLRKLRQKLTVDIAMQQGSLDTLQLLQDDSTENGG